MGRPGSRSPGRRATRPSDRRGRSGVARSRRRRSSDQAPLGYVAIVQPGCLRPARRRTADGPSARPPRRPARRAGLARSPRADRRRRDVRVRQGARSRRRCARWSASEPPGSAVGGGQARRSSSSCRGSTRPARTGRSPRSWRRSTRRAARSRRSRCRPPRSSATTSCGASTSGRPRKGEIGIFNRSHYEDVLVVRVHELVPRRVWSTRYDQINDFEETLTRNGTTIVKFFLSIDRDEQRERFQERYDDPKKRWKFCLGDLEERKLLGRLPGGVRRGPVEDVDGVGAVVRHPGQPQLVPEPRGRDHPGRHDRRAQAGLSAGAGPARRTWSSSRRPRGQRPLPPPKSVPKTPRTMS